VYDLFVSYHWRDRELVEAVARELRDHGLKVFLDRWYLLPGQSWVAALAKVLGESGAAAIFLGPFGMGRWQQREMESALDRQARSLAFLSFPCCWLVRILRLVSCESIPGSICDRAARPK
jgi:TIR domain